MAQYATATARSGTIGIEISTTRATVSAEGGKICTFATRLGGATDAAPWIMRGAQSFAACGTADARRTARDQRRCPGLVPADCNVRVSAETPTSGRHPKLGQMQSGRFLVRLSGHCGCERQAPFSLSACYPSRSWRTAGGRPRHVRRGTTGNDEDLRGRPFGGPPAAS
jgi:hypothetical protein